MKMHYNVRIFEWKYLHGRVACVQLPPTLQNKIEKCLFQFSSGR